jgi:glycosyltransferase involved in cell wall biosynthesis
MHDTKPLVILAEDGPLVSLLRQRGIRVDVLPLPEAARNLRRASVTGFGIPAWALWLTTRYVVELARRIRRETPDLVHTNSLKAAVYGGIAGRLARVPVVWHIRDRIAPDYLPAFAVRLIRTLARILPTVVIANSYATLETLGRTQRWFTVVPSPVVHDPVSPAEAAPQSSPRPFTVGMLGRLAPWKGQDIFLEAFARAFPDGDQRAVVIGSALFGEDDYEAHIRRLPFSLGVGDRVTFTGFVDDVAVALQGIDALVHASIVPEPFGQVVVEGMAAGLPVVAAGAGGPTEVIDHGVNGLLFPPSDVTALSGALHQLEGDAALRGRLGAAARRRVALLSPDRVARQVEDVYRSLLARGRE